MRSAACGADEVSSVGRRSSAEWLNETRRHTTHLRFDVSQVSEDLHFSIFIFVQGVRGVFHVADLRMGFQSWVWRRAGPGLGA